MRERPGLDGDGRRPAGSLALAGFFAGQLTLGDAMLPAPDDGNDDVFAGILSPDGTTLWGVAVGSDGSPIGTGVAFDPQGALLVTGSFSDTLDFGTGPLMALSTDTFLAKLDHDGTAVWAMSFGADDGGPTGAGDSSPAAVAVDGAGNVAIGGTFSGTIGFGGGPLFTGSGIGETSFVAAFDGAGTPRFSLDFGGGATSVTALAFDAEGDLYVGGINDGTLAAGSTVLTTSTTSGYVVKLAPSGAPLWALQLDGDGSTVASLAVGAGGEVLLGGTFQGHLVVGSFTADASALGANDGLVVQVSADGTPQWIKDLGGAPLSTLAAPSGGGAVVTGTYTGTPDFGAGPLPPTFAPVLFATRLDGQGRHVRTTALQVTSSESDSDMNVPGALATGVAALGTDVIVAGTYSGAVQVNGTTLTATGPGDLFAARFAF